MAVFPGLASPPSKRNKLSNLTFELQRLVAKVVIAWRGDDEIHDIFQRTEKGKFEYTLGRKV